MLDSSQLALALREVSVGAAVVVQTARASDASPHVRIPAALTYQAVAAPLARLALLYGEEVPKPRAKRPRKRRKPRRAVPAPVTTRGLPEPEELDDFERVSEWDPDERPYSLDSDLQAESGNCRALLLEIVRRAAFDWVLYRTHSKLQQRLLADNAHHWLFQETPESPIGHQRHAAGKVLTGFIAICEAVGVDPDVVRARIRMLTERDIMGAGRPAEKRKRKASSDDMLQSDDLAVFDVNVDSLPTYDPLYFVSEG